jgi:hypothetical protein
VALGLFFLVGDRGGHRLEVDVVRAAGRPRPAVRDLCHHRVMAQREVAKLGSDRRVDAETESPNEDER